MGVLVYATSACWRHLSLNRAKHLVVQISTQVWWAKAAALGFSLIQNHPFIDGNKRVGHAAMEVSLLLNGGELVATTDESESVVLAVASGELDRAGFIAWALAHQRCVSEG